MSTSLSKRIFRSFFINSLISLAVVMIFVWFVFEDMEDALLARDSREQLHFLRRDSYLANHYYWHFESLSVYFRPASGEGIETPELFRGITVPYSGEIHWQGHTYHIYSHDTEEGEYFLAKDVSQFEHREYLFGIMLLVLCLIVIILNFLLAALSNRRLIKPLQQLTVHIRRSIPSRDLIPIDTHLADAELIEIAKAFNWVIHEISSLIERERTMISLAGHELKTPIAVISGALQVIEQRNALSASDKKTFSRIKQACQEMRENMEALLTLSRRSRSDKRSETITVNSFLDELINEIEFINQEDYRRIQKHWKTSNIYLQTDPVLAKLLIRNLIRNALNHTKGAIRLILTKNYLDILDQGPGLEQELVNAFRGNPSSLPKQEGLGLYLVTLACEQLKWNIEPISNDNWRHGFRLFF